MFSPEICLKDTKPLSILPHGTHAVELLNSELTTKGHSPAVDTTSSDQKLFITELLSKGEFPIVHNLQSSQGRFLVVLYSNSLVCCEKRDCPFFQRTCNCN